MKNPRFTALASLSLREKKAAIGCAGVPQNFGMNVFNKHVIQKMLPKKVSEKLFLSMEGKAKFPKDYADTIAHAMKEWAIGLGASHYCHWFQPLTGATAEKHDAFIEWSEEERILEKFSGKQLLQGESDASSFPSGGLRTTSEARGYTGWDPTSPPFVWNAGNGITLCIPSVFFSWTGDVLDSKIPLLRAEKHINQAVLRLLKFTGMPIEQVYSTLGCEQEYFVIDRALRNLRPDLLLIGRTVFGAPSPKGQELQDHYFGAVKERVLFFMREFEWEALRLGIPVKTRHNEVAPSQHEIAPVFERTVKAIDHNILLMELMRQIAAKHELSCLLHEKPFQGINGSGKHCNWSIATDSGINLLDPSDTPENQIHFLILLLAVIKGVHRHAGLLRASIACAANDCRLGGHEAPPPIISIYLGRELEAVLTSIESFGKHMRTTAFENILELGIVGIPDLKKDTTDRNRTSPFAFTGNKFEFRAVGSSANPAFPITVLNAIVAESLHELMDDIEGLLAGDVKEKPQNDLLEAIMPILQKTIRECKPILFEGDNYSQEWKEEALRRGLPVLESAADAFGSFLSDSTKKVFEGILSPHELQSYHDIASKTYITTLRIEADLMLEMFRTQVFPAAIKQQKLLAEGIAAFQQAMGREPEPAVQKAGLKKLVQTIDAALQAVDILESNLGEGDCLNDNSQKAMFYSKSILNACQNLRLIVDRLETMVGDEYWPLPKYRELLFMV